MAPAPAVDEVQDDQDGSQSLAKGRSRREKSDKKGRFAALERLKAAKASGEKHKYEVEDEDKVYDIVDENEYSDLVRQRQEDDWIIDDDGAGYVEDGREIFDEDLNGGDEFTKVDKKKRDGPKKKNDNIRKPGTKPKTNIKTMFSAMPTVKKSEKNVSLANDDLLGDLMEELHKGPQPGQIKPAAVKLFKKTPTSASRTAYNPFKSTTPKAKPSPLLPRSISREFKSEPQDDSYDEPDSVTIKPRKRLAPKVLHKTGDSKVLRVRNTVEGVVDDTPQIDEFDSMDVTEADCTEVSANHDESAVDIADIDFDEEVEDVKEAPSVVKVKSEPTSTVEVKSESLSEESLHTGWETVKMDFSGEGEAAVMDIHVDSSQLPLVANSDGDQVLRFYWLDAYEDVYKHPGVVYLFGKVWIESAKAHVSCCVTVKNIERKVFLLPRQTKWNLTTNTDLGSPITMVDVYSEFNDKIAEKYKILKFKSMKVTKDYAFEKADVPAQSDYLEVRYSADLPKLPSALTGETFSCIFGANTSSLELFLMDRKIKGPCWLDVKLPQIPNANVSWCKVEAFINKPDHVTVLKESVPPPPLVVMTINLRTLPNPKSHQNEVVGVSCLIHREFRMDKPAPKQHFQQHISAISKPSDCIFPYDFKDKLQKETKMKVEILPTERALLGFLLAKIHKIDPDVLVGHDVFGFDMDVILHRINANKVPHWSRIGRLRRQVMPRLSSGPGRGSTFGEKSAACGRMVCDVKISARELIRVRSYDLTELVSHILHQKRVEVDYDTVRNMYSSSRQLLQLIELGLMDASHILKIMYDLNVLPLALQITNICGNILGRTLMGGRSERNEYLLLHAFHEKNFIVPDKEYKKNQPVADAEDEEGNGEMGKRKQGRKKPSYAGGLVLEPKRGFYDKYILLLDFNSLYPSIIQEYNICFTTIDRTNADKTQEGDEEGDSLPELPEEGLEAGILPTEIRKLVESRKQVKQLMKGQEAGSDLYMQYDIRQKALKLTANSMYGCLGFSHSRFYAKPLAALVTGKGREILMKTRDLVQGMNLDVIYGDTDSIMINTNSTDMDQVWKLGNKVKTEVNKLYRLLELDIDGVFKCMLLLKKKKYAALSIQKTADGKYTTSQELKGLDIVRRDWCDLAKEAGNFVVSQILSGESREIILENIHSKLTEVGEKVNKGEVPHNLFHITKNLTKNPEDYPDKKSLPHVQVALRMNTKGGKKMRAGDVVAYVVCEDGSNLAASQRAYHPDELLKMDNLKIDVKYYLANQVHPVISRLCDPIDGTDAAHLAECLGLDPSGYKHKQHTEVDEDEALLAGSHLSEEEKYKDCDRFKWKCPGPECGRENIWDSVFSGAGTVLSCSLSACQNSQCRIVPNDFTCQISNQLTLAIRRHIKTYHQGWMRCEDSTCMARVQRLPLQFQKGHPVCPTCQRGLLHAEYTDSSLYYQLCFYQHIFDLEKATKAQPEADKNSAKTLGCAYSQSYLTLKSVVERHLKQNAYSEVNLSRLFHGLAVLK